MLIQPANFQPRGRGLAARVNGVRQRSLLSHVVVAGYR